MAILFTAFAVGLLGSFHCVGMCGPIALALPSVRRAPQQAIGSLVYNSGRLLTYGILGAFFGLIGQGLTLAGFQQTLSIVIGALMILVIIIPVTWQRQLNPNSAISKAIVWVKIRMQHWLQVRTYRARFVLGGLNGLLPCGLVYLGIAGAIASGNMLWGGLYMFAFGLGTFPAMTLVGFLGNNIRVGVRNRIRAAIPIFVIIIGAFFILRGLSLDIPYVSPVLPSSSAATTETVICH